MAKKSAAGSGTIRKKIVKKGGKEYIFWEARYTVGTDPGTGKPIRRSITGKTQKEVAQKLKAATAAIDAGTYLAPNKMTVGQWLDTWTAEYLGGIKDRSVQTYKDIVRLHLKPAIGAVRLEALTPTMVQKMLNDAAKGTGGKKGLAPKTVRCIHGVLHKALQQAVEDQIIRSNPADGRKLPTATRRELHPLDENEIKAFLAAIKGHEFEDVYLVTLFTGLRQGEVLGLTWDCVDFTAGTITINKQLQRPNGDHKECYLALTKNGKGRCITPAPFVMNVLKQTRAKQNRRKLKAGSAWENHDNLVFTDALGHHLQHHTIYHRFKDIVESIGCPDTRFHDLRHSFAVVSIRSGDDIKTVQENLGHATAAFTLDIYGHVTEQMKRESASRMEGFIQAVSNS